MSDCACRSAALPSWFQPIYVLIHESCLDHLNIASLFCLSDDILGVGRVICSWNKYSWCHFAPLQLVEPLGHFHGCSHYWRAPPSSTRIGSADSVFMFIRNCESSLRGVGLWSTLTSAAKVGEWQKDPAAAMTSYRPCQNRCMWYVISVCIHQINLEWNQNKTANDRFFRMIEQKSAVVAVRWPGMMNAQKGNSSTCIACF